jgi:hypothetical protein
VTKQAFQQLVSDKINERLKGAMTQEPMTTLPEAQSLESTRGADEAPSPSVVELGAFQIIRAILHPVLSPRRVFLRDAASYCAILFDDNNRKPLCRLRFNNEERLVIGLFDENKEEERVPLASLDDLFSLDERLKARASLYLKPETEREPVTETGLP